MVDEWRQGEYLITTDKARMDVELIHDFLTHSYWAAKIPLETVKRSIEHSLAFGLFCGERQIGFARAVTDYATYAYIADVFVLEAYQRQGLGRWLMKVIIAHPQLQGLRRWSLVTKDAHALYESVGFSKLSAPERHMEMTFPDIYARAEASLKPETD